MLVLRLGKGAFAWLGGAALVFGMSVTDASATPTTQFCLTGSTADDCKIQLDISNLKAPYGSSLPGNAPYVSGSYVDNTVDHSLAPNQVLVTMNAEQFTLNSKTYQFNFAEFGLNLANKATVSNITFTGSDAYTGIVKHNHAMDGFGKFSDVLLTSPNGAPGNSSLSFVLTFQHSVVGDLETSQILALNSFGASAAAHIIVNDITDGTTGVVTGFAAWPNSCDQNPTPNCIPNPPPEAPEPGSLSTLGVGLAALGLYFGWRRRAA